MQPEGGTPRLAAGALERILELTRALARPMDLEALLEQIVDAARSVLDAERGTVFLYESSTEELVSKVATGSGELRVSVRAGIVGECARTRAVINVPDCYADPRFNRDVDRQTGYRTRCLMAVPLIGNDDSLEGVLQVLTKSDGVFTPGDEAIATALGAQCAVALQRTRLLEDRVAKERMEQELLIARSIQRRILPQTMPTPPGHEIAGWSRSADQTGGDVYDVVQLPDGRVILLLGDATGHGIGPALSVTQVRAMLRMCLRFGGGIGAALRNINDQLSDDLDDNRFVSAFLGELDPATGVVRYHSAGQSPLIHMRPGADPVWLDSTTMPLGILAGLPTPDSRGIELAPGERLFLATDGIYEYENPAQEQFGRERVLEVLASVPGATAEESIRRIVEAVERFSEGASQADDMTVLVVRRVPS